MERVNLNLPAEARLKLRRLARKAKLPEAELVRGLLLRALDELERDALAEAVARSRTAERRARDQHVARALERLRG